MVDKLSDPDFGLHKWTKLLLRLNKNNNSESHINVIWITWVHFNDTYFPEEQNVGDLHPHTMKICLNNLMKNDIVALEWFVVPN